MNGTYLNELLRARRNRTIRHKIMMCLAVIIVFATTYMLILPAITMTHDTYCGLEHEHTEECYIDPEQTQYAETEFTTESISDSVVEDMDTAGADKEATDGEIPQKDTEETITVQTPEVSNQLAYEDDMVSIEVTLPEGYDISPNTSLVVEKQSKYDGDYINNVSVNQVDDNEVILEQRQYSLGISEGGQNVELNEEAEVSIKYHPDAAVAEDVVETRILEVSENNAELLAETGPNAEGSATASFLTSEFQSYEVMAVGLAAGDVAAGEYGKIKITYNDTVDAFTKDDIYLDYYNDGSPLGTAGSFHLVGFGTVHLQTHTNGNVLANTLIAGSNFGTNNYEYELTYVQNYQSINSGSASGTDKHILVIGSNNTLSIGGNNDQVLVNGTKLDRPYNVIKDTDTESAPFIDLDRVEQEIQGIADRLAANKTSGVTVSFNDENRRSIKLDDPGSVGVYTTTAKDLQAISNFSDRRLQLTGFESGYNGTIVINVDCKDVKYFVLPDALVVIDGKEQSTNETTVFTAGKVIWNFINAEGATIDTKRMTGMVIAPGATVNITQNLNGTVVAENINVKAESHRTDFTGDVETPDGDEDYKDAFVKIRKVDEDNISIYLDGAKFNLYKWDHTSKSYVLFRENLTYEPGSALVIENLTYNTAYKLAEVESPNGYKLGDTPLEFMVTHKNTSLYPVRQPTTTRLHSLSNGQTTYFLNEKLTELIVEKIWTKSDGSPADAAPVSEILIDVWRNVYLDEERTSLNSSRVYEENVSVTETGGWLISLGKLPASGTEQINGKATKVYYTYFVQEQPMEGYEVSYEGNSGTVNGMVVITNREIEQYVLPETGGTGTWPYTLAGLLIIAAALIYIYKNEFTRRKWYEKV